MEEKNENNGRSDGQPTDGLDNGRTIQDIQLELIERTQRNELNGKKIVEDLKANRHLWKGAILTMAKANTGSESLIPLRDISLNIWNADTLYIQTDVKNMDAIKKLASRWDADDIRPLSEKAILTMLGTSPENLEGWVIRVWWD